MTITFWEIALYTGGLLALFLTPGPVWVALMARSLHGGFAGAWPLAVGVVLGDMLWSLLAVLGVTWIAAKLAVFMTVLRWVACIMFLAMGARLIWTAARDPGENTRLTRPGMWAGFTAGLISILGNPKAILFYMGVLPGFFDLTQLRAPDVAVIVGISALVPLMGNLILGLAIHHMRARILTPARITRLNKIAGGLLIVVGVLIAVA
jgi:threonine/homoserine/homoserine lactone efflux protein